MPSNNRPTVRFVHMSDTHIVAGPHRRTWWIPGSPVQQLQQAIQQIAGIPDLDFVLITGDLVDTADRASYELLQQLLQALPIPYYLSAGNHDLIEVLDPRCQTHLQKLRPRFTREDFRAWCQPQFDFPPSPTERLDYSLSPLPGLRLIALDSNIDATIDQGMACSVGVLRPAQFEWLAAELAAHEDEWVIVMIHHPPFVTALSRPWSPFLFRHYRVLPAQARHLHQVLRQHPQVAVVLSGHWHLPQLYQRQGIPYLTAPGLVGPIPAFRLLELEHQTGVLRYEWHRVRPRHPRPVPLWAPLASGRPWDRQGVLRLKGFPMPQLSRLS